MFSGIYGVPAITRDHVVDSGVPGRPAVGRMGWDAGDFGDLLLLSPCHFRMVLGHSVESSFLASGLAGWLVVDSLEINLSKQLVISGESFCPPRV